MAFNPTFEARKKQSLYTVADQNESSLFSESQTSWVVFNPRVSNDILSLSTSDQVTERSRFDEEEQDEQDEDEDEEDDDYEDEDLIDHLHHTLSQRIDEWQKSTEAVVSDNIASWDLDAEFVSQILDTSILRKVPAFYGDNYFKNMSTKDYIRFKQTSARLRDSLSRRGFVSSDPDIFSRLLTLLLWHKLIGTSGSLVDDYIVNTLSRVHFSASTCKRYKRVISDTATSSSLVICGGGSSWNDL